MIPLQTLIEEVEGMRGISSYSVGRTFGPNGSYTASVQVHRLDRARVASVFYTKGNDGKDTAVCHGHSQNSQEEALEMAVIEARKVVSKVAYVVEVSIPIPIGDCSTWGLFDYAKHETVADAWNAICMAKAHGHVFAYWRIVETTGRIVVVLAHDAIPQKEVETWLPD